MDHLKTKSPITKGQIKALFNSAEKFKTAKTDGVVLSNLLKLCYLCGLRKGELIGLSIGDVSKKGVVKDKIIINGQEIFFIPKIKKLIDRHSKYLRANGYQLYSSRPLFPARDNKPYNEKNLQNHLKKLFIDVFDKITLDKIRKAAVCHFYDDMKRAGERPQACLEKTSDFARISIRATENLLLDKAQPNYAKPNLANPVDIYLKEIEDLKNNLLNSKYPKDRGDCDSICRKIENDQNLNAYEKDALKALLNKSVKHAINQPRAKSEPTPKNFNKALREEISNFHPPEPSYDEIPDDPLE